VRSLVWAQMALDDLAAIARQIGLADTDAAARVVLTIQQRALRLQAFPLSGARLDLGNTRKLSIVRYPYVIAYDVEPERVIILRVRHTSRDVAP
jgi:toxin ParE1/3/4